jgi:hypothetical protein
VEQAQTRDQIRHRRYDRRLRDILAEELFNREVSVGFALSFEL